MGLFLVLFVNLNSFGQGPYQKSVSEGSKHFHDLNIEPLADGSNDYVVAGNLFDASMTNEQLFLQRVDALGNIVWINTYTHPTFQHLRIFDVVTFESFIIFTGSVDVGGVRNVFIAKVDGSSGALIDAKYYEIVSPNFNSTGMHIEFSESDATGNGLGDIGFVAVGYFSDCYNVTLNCNNNIGFVIRTDFSLNLLWTVEVDTNLSTNNDDYDFINDITQTDDGFFLTGSATVTLPSGGEQQAVMAHKIDFLGNQVWDQSYYFGNSRDIGVDAWYDNVADELYLLTNYSFSHYFGVTVLDDSVTGAGAIDLSRSWYSFDWGDLNRYGFTIMESLSNPANLVISGYDRDESWVDGNNNSLFGNSNIFVYEFNKSTGAQVGPIYQYTVPHVEPTGDDYNYWFWQMPLMYYPDMSFMYRDPANVNSSYYHIGYRTMSSGITQTEMFRTPQSKVNNCDFISKLINNATINPNPAPVTSGFTPNNAITLTMNITPATIMEEICDSTLGSGNINDENGSIFPNPASARIFIGIENITEYRIHSVLGVEMKSGSVLSDNSVYIGDLADGMYLITVTTDYGKSATLRFIKK